MKFVQLPTKGDPLEKSVIVNPDYVRCVSGAEDGPAYICTDECEGSSPLTINGTPRAVASALLMSLDDQLTAWTVADLAALDPQPAP